MRVTLWTVTIARVVLIPVFLLFAGRAQEVARAGGDAGTQRWTAITILLVIGFSDIADGWIARRFDLATRIGAIADAAADKLVQVMVIAFLVFNRGPAFLALPFWFLGVVVARDLLVGLGWLAMRLRRVPLPVVHRFHGRLSWVAIFSLLFWAVLRLPAEALLPLAVLSASLVTVSTAAYLMGGVERLKDRQAAAKCV